MGLLKDIQGLMAGEEIDFLGTGIGRPPSFIRPAPPLVPCPPPRRRHRFFVNDPYFGALAGIH